MKVGILTYHAAINYGAFLQAYALCERLNAEDFIEAEIINYRSEREIKHYSPTRTVKQKIKHPVRSSHYIKTTKEQMTLFEKDREKMHLSEKSYFGDDIEEFRKCFAGDYDVFVTGSDEIWKTNGFRGFPTPYWLPGDFKALKVSYAASGRNDYSKMTEEDREKLKSFINDFSFIGTRDTKTKNEIEKFTEKQAVLCCDPVFLYDFKPDAERGKELLKERFGITFEKPVVAVMTENEDIPEIIRKKAGNEKYELIALYKWHPGYKDVTALSPFEWVDVIASLNLLVTSFFHGVCISIKSETPILPFGTGIKSDKVGEILKNVGREDEMILDLSSFAADNDLAAYFDKLINKGAEHFLPDSSMFEGYEKMVAYLKNQT